MKSYAATITIPKSAEIVFHCIQAISKWWTKDFEGSTNKLDDEFVIHHPDAHYSKQRMIEFFPNKKIAWLVTDSKLYWLKGNQEEWTDTKIIFDLTEIDGETLVHFTHQGLIAEKECYERCSQGWNLVIKERLFNFIVTGQMI